MIKKKLQHISIYQHDIFDAFPEILQVTTNRAGGFSLPPFDALNLGENTSDEPARIMKNINLLQSEIAAVDKPDHFILPVQVHGNNVVRIDADFLMSDQKKQKSALSSCDALMTDIPGVFIGIRTADCVPVSVYFKDTGSVAVIHAGWRGIVNGIIAKTLKVLDIENSPDSVFCGIGPCIEGDKYEVGRELIVKIEEVLPGKAVWFKRNNRYYLDLKMAAFLQLEWEGIPGSNIESCSFCTWKNNNNFYSYRKEEGNTGRFLTGIMVKNIKSQ